MKNLNSWLFLLVALVWLLPLVGVDFLVSNNIGTWIVIIAFAVIGIMGLMNK